MDPASITAIVGFILPKILKFLKKGSADWSSWDSEPGKKEAYLSKSLEYSFQYARDNGTPALPIFQGLIGKAELDDDYATWYGKNTDWVPGRIAGIEEKYGFKITDTPVKVNPMTNPLKSLAGLTGGSQYLVYGLLFLLFLSIAWSIVKHFKK